MKVHADMKYKINFEKNKIILTDVRDFDADQIFNCGQCFRFEREKDGSYTGTAHNRIINVLANPGYESGEVIISNITDGVNLSVDEMRADFEKIWREYFDLDRDYRKIKKKLSKRDPIIAEAIKCGEGIRILRQDPWETVVSFIISQNNNIPRIKKCIDSLAYNFGERIGTCAAGFGESILRSGDTCSREYYSLPGFDILAKMTPEELSACRLGYRARYLIETAMQVSADGGSKLYNLTGSGCEAVDYISGFCGVGPKVANCIALFSMGVYDSFPIDVWVKKVMHDLYGFDENDIQGMTRFAAEVYGRYSGIAQQYLFYYARRQK